MLGGVLEVGTRPTEIVVSEVDDGSRRRFTGTAIVGSIVASLPYLWILTNNWTGSYNLRRGNAGSNTFYDKQAEAIIHGHLWVPTGSLGIEGFVHDGRTYTYFGILLSLLRIPFILVAPGLTGHLTVLSMLVAWLLTGLFSSLLIWRVRVLLRGVVALGWAEAVSFGVLVASIMGGSVLLFLASAPRVSDEDIAWTVPITIATLFVFAGILDRPSEGRVLAAGTLLLAGALERPPPGLACIVGALLIAGWFWLGHGDREGRRWALPMAVAGLIPLAVWSFVNWLKFGTGLSGLPLVDQVWTGANPHRRAFLAATGGKGYSFHFLPTTVWAYLQPFGLRVQPTFPFLSLPVGPSHVFGGYLVDILYPTPSVPATMPLLFLLSCSALVVAFRPRAGRGAVRLRIPLIVAAGATTVDFMLGYIAPRYLGDFLPFLVLGAAVGMVALWRRCERLGRGARRAVVAVVVTLGVFSMVANVGLAVTPTTKWSTTQAANYLRATKAISDVTGHPLDGQVVHGSVLPDWAPANEVFVAGDCAGLYLSSGQPVGVDATLQLEHRAWLAVEQGPGIYNKLKVTFTGPLGRLGMGVPILTVGHDTLLVRSAGQGGVRYVLDDSGHLAMGKKIRSVTGKRTKPKLGQTSHILVETDPYLHRLIVTMGRTTLLTGLLSGVGAVATPFVVHTQPLLASGSPAPLTVTRGATPLPDMSLCRTLQSP